MVLTYIEKHGSIKRADVMELCRLSGPQAYHFAQSSAKTRKNPQKGRKNVMRSIHGIYKSIHMCYRKYTHVYRWCIKLGTKNEYKKR